MTKEQARIQYRRLDAARKQWHGYTFTPHLPRLSFWRETSEERTPIERRGHRMSEPRPLRQFF